MARLHASLRWTTQVAMLLVWLAVALLTFSRANARLSPIALGLGALGGLLQWAAMRAQPQLFRAAQTARKVRGALKATRSGRTYLVLFWLSQLAFLFIAARATIRPGDGNPFSLFVPLIHLYAAFAVAREALTIYPALRLETGAAAE